MPIAACAVDYSCLGRRLAEFPDLFRNGAEGLGLKQILRPVGVLIRMITRVPSFTLVLADRLRIRVMRDGENHWRDAEGRAASEFVAAVGIVPVVFRPLDSVVRTSHYSSDFSLGKKPGYHDGGVGERVLSVGPVPEDRRHHRDHRAILGRDGLRVDR